MKVFVIQSGSGDPTWSHTVKLEQGVQSFALDYKGTLQEAQWYAEQFQVALDAHTAEVIAANEAQNRTPDEPAQSTGGESTSVQTEVPTQLADATSNGTTTDNVTTAPEASDVPAAQ